MLDTNIFVGAYLECEYHLVDSLKYTNSCQNIDCLHEELNNDFNYCPLCGNKIRKHVIPIRVPNVKEHYFMEKISERLYIAWDDRRKTKHYYVDNVLHSDITGIKLNNYDTQIYKLEVNFWIVNFENKFKSEIEIAEKIYDKVEIKTGVLYWLS